MITPQAAHEPGEAGSPARAVTLVEAMSLARRTVAMFTELPVDQVAECTPRGGGGGWRVVVDVVESKARLGDNDMLGAYEVMVDAAGEVAGFQRIGRYNRTDAARG